MKIVVYSMAHRGDVFPFVPIASELVRRGHDVTFVVPREFHPVLAAEPFRCVHSGTDFSPIELDEHGAFLRRWGMKMGGAVTLRLYFGEFTVPHLETLFTAVDAELADADLLVSHPAASLVGAMACERRGIPWIVGDLFPMLVPTATGPPSGMPDLGGTVNRAMWRLGRSRLVDPLTSRRAFVAFRRRLGLATDCRWNVVDARLSPYHNLALVSAHYVAPAADWPSNYRLVGFTSWSGSDAGVLPAEVERFLDDGPPPVAVTLGTSGATADRTSSSGSPTRSTKQAPGACSSPRTPPSPTACARRSDRSTGSGRSFPSHRCYRGPAGSYSPEPTGPTPSRSRPACRRSSCRACSTSCGMPVGRTNSAPESGPAAAATSPTPFNACSKTTHSANRLERCPPNWPPNTALTSPATRSKPSCPPPDSRARWHHRSGPPGARRRSARPYEARRACRQHRRSTAVGGAITGHN